MSDQTTTDPTTVPAASPTGAPTLAPAARGPNAFADPAESGRRGGRRSGEARRARSIRQYVAALLGVTVERVDWLRRRGLLPSLSARDVRAFVEWRLDVSRTADPVGTELMRGWKPAQRRDYLAPLDVG